MNKLLLTLIRGLAPFWRSVGVDPIQLVAMLEAKLVMDSRRATVFNNKARGAATTQSKNQDWLAMAVFFMMGLFLLTLFFVFSLPATALVIYFTVWMFMLAMTLIADFTDVLIDVRDNYILLPRPVSDRTIAVSRIIHIALYLSKLTLAFGLPVFIYMMIAHFPMGGPVFLLQLLLSVVIVIFGVNLIYLLILRFTTAARFREIISYFQIAFSVILLTSYYLLPRIVDFTSLKDADMLTLPLLYPLPSSWVASLWCVMGEGDTRGIALALSTLALITPLVAIFLIVEVLAKHFNRKMMAIAEGTTGEEISSKPEKAAKTTKKSDRLHWLAAKICRTPAERASFEWVWVMTQRSRDFKLRSYPSLAFVIVLFLYYMLQGNGSLREKLMAASQQKWYVLLVYLAWIAFSTLLINSTFSNKFKASWVFASVPLKNPGPILTGAFKAIVFRFLIPYIMLLTIIAVSVWGLRVLDDFAFGFLNILIITLVSFNLLNKFYLPFSNSWANQSKGNNISVMILTMILAGLLGTGHFFIVDYNWLVLLLIAPQLVILIALLRRYRHTQWRAIRWAGE